MGVALASSWGLSSRKGPSGNDRPAKLVMGSNSPAEIAGRIEGGVKMERRAINMGATTVVPATTVMPACERDAAQEFSAVILPFSRGELARAANRTKDAARKWKEGIALPNAYTMLMLGRKIPAVRNWMASKLNLDQPLFASPQALDVLMAALYQVAHQPGPDGDAVRALLAKMGKGQP